MSIYRPCSIRGDADQELSPDMFRNWGFTLGRQLAPADKFVVGGDGRRSTPTLKAALVDGLCLAGVDCIDLGELPTPLVYHAKRRIRAAGCAMVTASHHPPSQNGLVWMLGSRPPCPDQIERLRQAADRPLPDTPDRPKTAPRSLDTSFDYVATLQETWCDAMPASQHVVLDLMHGCWSGRARRYLHAIFPACLISVVRDGCDPDFGGQNPDCSQPEHLDELCERVDRERAHLGIAFDGDGDQIAIVDNRGVPLSVEETAWILMRSLGRKLRGQSVLYDQKLSDRVPEMVRRFGAEPRVQPSATAHFHGQMRESGAIFGAHSHGHYFFGDLDGDADSLYAACHVIAYLAESGKPLDQLRRRCPKVFTTPDISLRVTDDMRDQLLDKLRAAWSEFPQCTLDGLRIDLPGGWALVRSAPDEAALTFRFESLDWPALDETVRRVCATLPDEVGVSLWSRYEFAMGRGE
jgi:phosphomannomutase